MAAPDAADGPGGQAPQACERSRRWARALGAHAAALIACCFLASLAIAVAWGLCGAGGATAPREAPRRQAREEVVVCAAFFVAGLTQGVLGFGSGIVAMAMLPQFMPLMDAVPIVGVLGCAVTLMLFLQLRADVDGQALSMLPPLLLGQLGGVPLGAWMLRAVDAAWLRLALGVTMCAFSAHQLLESGGCRSVATESGSAARSREASPFGAATKSSALVVGFLSGVLNGALTQGGPPIVAFFAMQKWERDRTKGALQSYFVCSSAYAVTVQASSGILLARHLCLGAAGLPAIALGLAAGACINRYVNTRVFFNLVMGSLLFLGGLFLFGALARLLPRSLAVRLPAVVTCAAPPLGG